jgi:hypothetical protein
MPIELIEVISADKDIRAVKAFLQETSLFVLVFGQSASYLSHCRKWWTGFW